MKTQLAINVFLLLTSLVLFGQSAANVQVGEIFFLDSGQHIKLERQAIQKRPNFFFFENLESSIQITSRTNIEMIVRVWDDHLDPIASVRLYKVKQNKLFKCRTVPVNQTKTSGKTGTNADFQGLSIEKRTPVRGSDGKIVSGVFSDNTHLSLINYDKLKRIYFTSEKYKPGFLKITLKDLKPGNYAIKVQNDERAWNLFDVTE